MNIDEELKIQDNSPVEFTCPKINRVMAFLKTVEMVVPEGEDLEYFHRRKESILDTLEEIREANQALRTWGNQQHKKAELWKAQAKHFKQLITQPFKH